MKQETTRELIIGFIALTIFNLTCAAQEVWLGNLLQGIHPAVLMFVCISGMALFFNVLQLRNVKSYYARIRKDFRDVVILNLTSAVGWGTYFVSLQYLEPAVEGAISLAISPVFMLMLVKIWGEGNAITLLDVVSALGIFISVTYLALSGEKGLSAVGALDSSNLWIGILGASACGVAISVSTYISKRLFNRGWNSTQPLAVRFPFLLFITVFFFPKENAFVFFHEPTNIFKTIILIFVGFIAPMFSVQIALQKVNPFLVSLLCALNPMFTFVLQLFDPRLSTSTHSLIGISFCVLFTCIGILKGRVTLLSKNAWKLAGYLTTRVKNTLG